MLPVMGYRQIIDDNFHILLRHIDPSTEFFGHLRASNHIRKEIVAIQQQPSPERQTEMLLNMFLTAPDDVLGSTMDTFMAALRATGQDHVANVFRRESDSTFMSDEHYELLSSKMVEICQFVEPRDGLLDILVRDKVFTLADRRRILSKTGVDDMAWEALSILLRKSDSAFDKFDQALKSQGQDHVVYIMTGKGKTPMSETHRNFLRKNFDQLCNSFDPENRVLSLLMSEGVLKEREWNRIRSQPAGSVMITEFVATLLRKADSAFDCFIQALKKSKQDHVVFILTEEGSIHPISDRSKRTLRENMEYLVNHMDPISDGLLTTLYAKGVVTDVEKERLECSLAGNYFDRIELLVNMIARKSQENFEAFITALRSSGQKHIADTLCGVVVGGSVQVQVGEGDCSSQELCETEVLNGMRNLLLRTNSNEANVKELTDNLRVQGIEVDDIESGSIIIRFRCKQAASMEWLEEMCKSGELGRLFTKAFCGNASDHGAQSLKILISDDEFQRVGKIFKEICPMSPDHKKKLRCVAESVVVTEELTKDLSLHVRALATIKADDSRDNKLLFQSLLRRPDVEFNELFTVLGLHSAQKVKAEIKPIREMTGSTSSECQGADDASGNSFEALHEHYLFLVNNLDMKYGGLLDHLFTDGVVNVDEMAEISSQPTMVRQNEKLLFVLSRKSAEQFHMFLNDLDKTGQGHIRDTLKNRPESKQANVSDSVSLPDDDAVLGRHHRYQQEEELKEQLAQACDRQEIIMQHLQKANETIDDLRRQLQSRSDAIKTLKAELKSAQQNEIATEEAKGHSDTIAQLELKVPIIGDMLYAFLSHLMTSKQLSSLLDNLVAKNVITAKEHGEIQRLTTTEEKVMLLLSLLKRVSAAELEYFVAAIIHVGQKQMAEAKLESSHVTHTLPMEDIVSGVTRLQDKVYVLYLRDDKQVGVYATKDYELVRQISVPELKRMGVRDITSSEENNCLYLSDAAKHYIHVVVPKYMTMATSTEFQFNKWSLAETPCGLSVTSTGNLLVTCMGENILMAFNPHGECVGRVVLHPSIKRPYHAIQLPSGNFLCSHGVTSDDQHRVCLVDATGNLKLSFGHCPGFGEFQLKMPTHIAVDGDGFVFVADRDTARVVLLSPSLQFVGVLLPSELQRPTNHVYIDHSTNRLYASSLLRGEGRSVVTVVQL